MVKIALLENFSLECLVLSESFLWIFKKGSKEELKELYERTTWVVSKHIEVLPTKQEALHLGSAWPYDTTISLRVG